MPMINLTREAGIKIGPVLLETLVKHYFERILRDDSQLKDLPQLRQDELLYDEAFNIVKVRPPSDTQLHSGEDPVLTLEPCVVCRLSWKHLPSDLHPFSVMHRTECQAMI